MDTNFYYCGEKTFQLRLTQIFHFIEKNNIKDDGRIIKLKICCVNFNYSSFSLECKICKRNSSGKKANRKGKSGTTNWKKEKARMKHVIFACKLFSFIN